MTTLAPDQQPRAFDGNAAAYIEQNADTINSVAAQLGTPAAGIAGSIAREITRPPYVSYPNSFAHSILEENLLSYDNESLQASYDSVQKLLASDPGALEGGNLSKLAPVFEPVLADVGPGHFRVFDAIRLIQDYVAAGAAPRMMTRSLPSAPHRRRRDAA